MSLSPDTEHGATQDSPMTHSTFQYISNEYRMCVNYELMLYPAEAGESSAGAEQPTGKKGKRVYRFTY